MQTSLGAIPGPAQVWQQATVLWADHVAERQKEADFYTRQDKHNAELVASGQQDKVKVRPFLGQHAGDVELLAVDGDAGAVLLRLKGSCDGCPSSAVTLKLAIERAILDAAPEINRIDVDEPEPTSEPVPIMLRPRPIHDECPSGVVTG